MNNCLTSADVLLTISLPKTKKLTFATIIFYSRGGQLVCWLVRLKIFLENYNQSLWKCNLQKK